MRAFDLDKSRGNEDDGLNLGLYLVNQILEEGSKIRIKTVELILGREQVVFLHCGRRLPQVRCALPVALMSEHPATDGFGLPSGRSTL